ncbi:MAG: hypothetical protein NVS4B5_06140 [Vulcanimicrobiaceae bacterium]
MHRANEHEGPFSLHVLGIGKTGAAVIARLLNDPPKGFLDDPKTRFGALAVDIGDGDLGIVRDAPVPAERAHVRTVALPVPTQPELMTSLNRWREYLKMEYPRYYWNPNYEPWLPSDVVIPSAGQRFPRALAKSIYGSEYYQGREIATALDEFAANVFAAETTPLVCVVFSLAGAGSGIAVEISRHLSSIKLGRRPWVVGIGVMPCAGDAEELKDGRFFPAINEIDCMVDAEKNRGVMAVWGDLYKNPFTGGFFAVPQDEVFELTGDLAATHDYVDAGIASFIARDSGVHLYETLKALNWLSVPQETWHPAIRGELGERWINILTSRNVEDAGTLGHAGLASGFATEYVEARVFSENGKAGATIDATAKAQLAMAAGARVEPGVLHFESDDQPMVHYVIPRASKLDLQAFVPARDAYDTMTWDQKLMIHAWLLDLGVMLCEPSIRFDGMGGECIWGCACWVVVPHAAIRGETLVPKVEALTV